MSAAMEVAAALEGNPCIVTLLRDPKYAIASDQLKFVNGLSDDLVTSSKFHGLQPDVMTEAEINALLDAHDVLVKACVDSALTFSEFVSAYGEFPHNYGLPCNSETAQQRFMSRLFGRRVAFHSRVAALLSGLRSADDPVDIPYEDAGRFLPAVGLQRLRELAKRYPDFKAETEVAG
jgi:hypothetical protein